MPALAGRVADAAVKPPVEDQPGAQPGAEGQENHVPNAATGAEFPLGHSPGIRIVLKPDRNAEPAAENINRRDLIPARQIRRGLDYAAAAVERAAAGDAAAAQPFVRDAVPGAELEPELRHPFETLPRRPGLGGGKFDFVENFDAAAGNRRAENAGALGSADVKAEEEIFFH